MFREMLSKMAFEVIYLETERKEHEEEEKEAMVFNARAKEARHIMAKLFGNATAVIAIVDAREMCKGMTAFEIWKEYVNEE